MPLPKIEDARKLSDQELTDAIVAAKRELFQLRFQQATRQLDKPHQFKHVRHRIAQLMTVERERQFTAATAVTEAGKGSESEGAAASPQPDT